jgi:hypothetical protein
MEPPFIFKCNQEVTAHNLNTISGFGSLGKMIQAFKSSPTNIGSESNHHNHKYWGKMLLSGSTFPIQNYDDELRSQDMELALKYYGNHKLVAHNNNDTLISHVKKEISKGRIVPLLPAHAKLLMNAMISPKGVISQSTIKDRGEIILPSKRVTHDLSFPGKLLGLSVNSRIQMDLLEPCQYGHMLCR